MKRRPGRLWLFFWGRKRRGYPGLLTAVVVLTLVGALTIRSQRGYDAGFLLGIALLAVLAAVTAIALVAALIGVLRPRGRR